jgi:hypothetical protein
VAIVYEYRRQTAALIFDFNDQYARDLGVSGHHAQPIGGLRFHLVARLEGGNRVAIDPPLVLAVQPTPSGVYVFFDRFRTPDGAERGSMLPDGRYALRVESDFYQLVDIELQSVSQQLSLAPPAGPGNHVSRDLLPGYAYPFPGPLPIDTRTMPAGCAAAPVGNGPTLLLGSLHDVGGAPISGATVHIPGQPSVNGYRTDATGQWILVFPRNQPSGEVTIRVERPGQPDIDVQNVCLVRGRQASLHETSLRGAVLRAGVGVSGAVVTVDGHPGSATTRADGSWAYYFDPMHPGGAVSLSVTLPDGTAENRPNVLVKRRATVVVPVFRFP